MNNSGLHESDGTCEVDAEVWHVCGEWLCGVVCTDENGCVSIGSGTYLTRHAAIAAVESIVEDWLEEVRA